MAIRRPLLYMTLLWTLGASLSVAAPVIPGSGQKLAQVGDDFEDTSWSFVHNFPKSSEEQDEQKRSPTGYSTNRRWYEGVKRGQPDFMRVVPTPEGGLPGSTGSLLIRTLHSGIPGRLSYEMQQDDLVINCQQHVGTIDIAQSPSGVVRVYLPPFEQWENRTGPSFGIRLALETHAWKEPEEKSRSGFFQKRGKEFVKEVYWPGMFITFRSGNDRRNPTDSAFVTIRGNSRGGDFKGPEISQLGWWTFGISCTPDGMVHYYASPGIDALTAEDHVTSQYPYSYKAERFRTMFFNICNQDDGKTWSTPWIIDDPSIYIGGSSHMAQLPATQR
jgi:hypothetical protein